MLRSESALVRAFLEAGGQIQLWNSCRKLALLLLFRVLIWSEHACSSLGSQTLYMSLQRPERFGDSAEEESRSGRESPGYLGNYVGCASLYIFDLIRVH